MRIFVFWILLLCSFCCFSQVTDDFSDGDFTNNPTWIGEVTKFRVDEKKQLHLADDDKTGDAYLAVPSSLVRETEWTFYVHLQFNPSANNYALFYLTSTESDLSGEGYCVRIGGAEDNVCLMRYDGTAMVELIKGSPARLNMSSPALWIKVKCNTSGQWTLQTYVQKIDVDFVSEGTATDATITTSSFAGVRCVYTASRSTSFVFDDIVIKKVDGELEQPDVPEKPDAPEGGNPDDHTPPCILSVSAISANAVSVCFDEAIQLSGLSCRLEGVGVPLSQKLEQDGKQLTLTFAGTFTDMQTYSLELQGVRDLSGNVLSDSQIQFTYYDPSLHALTFGEIVFNEIMANPVSAAGLPEVEYVELYNKAPYPVSLKGWTFHYGNRKVALKEGMLPAQGYGVLCHAKMVEQWKHVDVTPIGVAAFPELANRGKLLWLTDARDNLIAWVEYSDTWYADEFKRKGGFSLECVDVENQTNDSSNWKASTDVSGGTPGRENSVKGHCSDETVAQVDYAYVYTPDTVVVCFTKPMLPTSLAVADNYTVLSGNVSVQGAIPSVPDARKVELVLSDSLLVGEVLELELQHLKDISGYPLDGNVTIRLGLPEEATIGDVLVNEILFNPLSGGTDYVELYNTSSKYLDLSRLLLTRRNAEGALSEGALLFQQPRTIEPGNYLCFLKNRAALSDTYKCAPDRLIELSKLPSLPNDKGNVFLVNRSGIVIDSLYYSDKMHAAFLRATKGVALEKIHPTLCSADKAHWTSASEDSGGGTPGLVNSQYRELDKEYLEEFVLDKQVFTPNGDGVDDELIVTYRLEESGVMAIVRVYDSAGRLVYSLAENELLATEGVFVWDGRKSDGLLSPIGMYIIYIETYAPSGKQKKHKLACVRSE